MRGDTYPGRRRGGADDARGASRSRRLSHPNLVTVYDVGTADGRVFVAMELIEGDTVAAWLDQQRRPRDEILRVFGLAGRGLAAAHRAGIIHRDFKPQNVMVTADGAVRVMDFGLAAIRQTLLGPNAPRLTRIGSILGTPLYMSPEQLCGQPVDPRADQFSFCVSLYEALYGERPFAGENFAQLRAAVLEGRPRPAPRIEPRPRARARHPAARPVGRPGAALPRHGGVAEGARPADGEAHRPAAHGRGRGGRGRGRFRARVRGRVAAARPAPHCEVRRARRPTSPRPGRRTPMPRAAARSAARSWPPTSPTRASATNARARHWIRTQRLGGDVSPDLRGRARRRRGAGGGLASASAASTSAPRTSARSSTRSRTPTRRSCVAAVAATLTLPPLDSCADARAMKAIAAPGGRGAARARSGAAGPAGGAVGDGRGGTATGRR